MESQLLETMFERMGARVKIRETVSRRHPAGIDIRSDKRGEYFDIGVEATDQVEYEVIDIRPRLEAPAPDGPTRQWQAEVSLRSRRATLVCLRRSRRIGVECCGCDGSSATSRSAWRLLVAKVKRTKEPSASSQRSVRAAR